MKTWMCWTIALCFVGEAFADHRPRVTVARPTFAVRSLPMRRAYVAPPRVVFGRPISVAPVAPVRSVVVGPAGFVYNSVRHHIAIGFPVFAPSPVVMPAVIERQVMVQEPTVVERRTVVESTIESQPIVTAAPTTRPAAAEAEQQEAQVAVAPEIGEEELSVLASTVRTNPDSGARKKAVGRLRDFPPDQRVEELLVWTLTKDPDKKVRKEAAEALGKRRDKGAIAVLDQVSTNDPSARVRNAAKKAAEKIRQ